LLSGRYEQIAIKLEVATRRNYVRQLMEDESFKILFGNLPLGVVFLGPTGAIVAANPRAVNILGLSKDEVLSQSQYDPPQPMLREDGSVFPRDEYPSVVARTTGRPVENVVMGVLDADRTVSCWLSVSAIPLLSEDVQIVRGALVTFLDITAKKLAEMELAAMARFPGEDPNPVMRLSAEGKITYANKASQILFECCDNQTGQAFPDFLKEARDQIHTSGQCHSFEVSAAEKTYVLMICSVESGAYFNVYGMDVTELKHSQKELQKERDFNDAVVQMAGSLVVVLDREGRIQRFNRACEDATGFTFDEARGQVVWDLMLPSEAIGPAKSMFYRLTEGNFPNTYESTWRTKDGGKRLILWRNTALQGDDGRVDFVISTGTDITEQRIAEESCEREMHSLEEMSAPVPAGVTATSLGLKRVSEAFPGLFAELTDRFADLLDKAVEMLVVKVDYDIPKAIGEISETLGSLRAGPRDATEIFLAALKKNCKGAAPEKCRAYREEGRIMLIELIGRLAVYFRNHSLGVPPPTTVLVCRETGSQS